MLSGDMHMCIWYFQLSQWQRHSRPVSKFWHGYPLHWHLGDFNVPSLHQIRPYDAYMTSNIRSHTNMTQTLGDRFRFCVAPVNLVRRSLCPSVCHALLLTPHAFRGTLVIDLLQVNSEIWPWSFYFIVETPNIATVYLAEISIMYVNLGYVSICWKREKYIFSRVSLKPLSEGKKLTGLLHWILWNKCQALQLFTRGQ